MVPISTRLGGKGALTKARILDAAMDLFHAQGVNATSVGDVLRASETGKGQFYQHFEGRDALVAAVFARYRGEMRRHAARPIDSWAALRDWMEMFFRAQKGTGFVRGCPIGTAAYALQADQIELRGALKEIFDGMRGNLAAFFRAERRAGRLHASADPRHLASFAIACVQGAMMLGLVDRRAAPVRAVIDEGYAHLRSYVVGEA